MMRIILLLMMLSTGSAWGQALTVKGAVDAFYDALKTGDVVSLQEMIEDPLYSQVEVLLTQNTEYPDFLRAHYKGSDGVVRSSSLAGENDATVDFEITYQDGSAETLRFRLQSQSGNTWKIVEQSLAD